MCLCLTIEFTYRGESSQEYVLDVKWVRRRRIFEVRSHNNLCARLHRCGKYMAVFLLIRHRRNQEMMVCHKRFWKRHSDRVLRLPADLSYNTESKRFTIHYQLHTRSFVLLKSRLSPTICRQPPAPTIPVVRALHVLSHLQEFYLTLTTSTPAHC